MIEAASVCTRSGKVLLSRQFVELSSERVHELLATLPKLVHVGSQHTTVEENGVRYLWEPLDELYVVLITDLTSNILHDIRSMRLLAQTIKASVTGGGISTVDERHVVDQTFSIIDAFDEVVTAGYAENLSLSQVETFLEMESHEEKIQEIIEHNKQLEAAEERKKKAKELEQQRKQARRTTPSGLAGGLGGGNGIGGGLGGGMGSGDAMMGGALGGSLGGSIGGSLGSARSAAGLGSTSLGGSIELDQSTSRGSRLGSSATGPKGKGLKLGKSKSGASATPLLADPEPAPTRELAAHSLRDSKPQVSARSEETEILMSEGLAIELTRDGQVRSSRATGTLNLYAGDRSKAKLQVHTKPEGPSSAYKPHPKMDRSLFTNKGVVGLRDVDQEFPASNVLLVKWSVEGISVPITVSCWVSESTDAGFMNVTLEYEVSPEFAGVLEDVTIKVPLLSANAHVLDPATVYEQFDDHLVWTIPTVSADSSPSGSFEFTAEAESEDDFYPLHVSFTAKADKPFGLIDVESVIDAANNDEVAFSKSVDVHTTSYTIR